MQAELEQVLSSVQNIDLNVSKIIADYGKWPHIYNSDQVRRIQIEYKYGDDEDQEHSSYDFYIIDNQYFLGHDGHGGTVVFKDGEPYENYGDKRKYASEYRKPENTLFVGYDDPEDEPTGQYWPIRVKKLKDKKHAEKVIEHLVRKLRVHNEMNDLKSCNFSICIDKTTVYCHRWTDVADGEKELNEAPVTQYGFQQVARAWKVLHNQILYPIYVF